MTRLNQIPGVYDTLDIDSNLIEEFSNDDGIDDDGIDKFLDNILQCDPVVDPVAIPKIALYAKYVKKYEFIGYDGIRVGNNIREVMFNLLDTTGMNLRCYAYENFYYFFNTDTNKVLNIQVCEDSMDIAKLRKSEMFQYEEATNNI